jgi:hypothetical protein
MLRNYVYKSDEFLETVLKASKLYDVYSVTIGLSLCQ